VRGDPNRRRAVVLRRGQGREAFRVGSAQRGRAGDRPRNRGGQAARDQRDRLRLGRRGGAGARAHAPRQCSRQRASTGARGPTAAVSTPAPPAAEKSMAVNEPEPAGDGPRWTELRGTVKVIAGNWIVVRTDKGQLVLVDLSTVRGGAASLRPGAAIALYGTPT